MVGEAGIDETLLTALIKLGGGLHPAGDAGIIEPPALVGRAETI